jgi:hypothetical protein
VHPSDPFFSSSSDRCRRSPRRRSLCQPVRHGQPLAPHSLTSSYSRSRRSSPAAPTSTPLPHPPLTVVERCPDPNPLHHLLAVARVSRRPPRHVWCHPHTFPMLELPTNLHRIPSIVGCRATSDTRHMVTTAAWPWAAPGRPQPWTWAVERATPLQP